MWCTRQNRNEKQNKYYFQIKESLKSKRVRFRGHAMILHAKSCDKNPMFKNAKIFQLLNDRITKMFIWKSSFYYVPSSLIFTLPFSCNHIYLNNCLPAIAFIEWSSSTWFHGYEGSNKTTWTPIHNSHTYHQNVVYMSLVISIIQHAVFSNLPVIPLFLFLI